MQRIACPMQQAVAAHAHQHCLLKSKNNDAVRPRARRMPARGPKETVMTHPRTSATLLLAFLSFSLDAMGAAAGAASDYSQHLSALGKLSVAVAEAMPPGQYAFRPDPGSMTFGELMSHLAATNYPFCAGQNDVQALTRLPLPTRMVASSS